SLAIKCTEVQCIEALRVTAVEQPGGHDAEGAVRKLAHAIWNLDFLSVALFKVGRGECEQMGLPAMLFGVTDQFHEAGLQAKLPLGLCWRHILQLRVEIGKTWCLQVEIED